MIVDRFFLRRQLKLLRHDNKNYSQLINKIKRSAEKALARKNQQYTFTWDEQLPVIQKKQEIAELIDKNQVVIIAGETGSGKTTQLPKICLELRRGVFGSIGHTQPRRLAARTVAARIAQELGVSPGDLVGYQVRFSDQSTDNTCIKLMTDGILLAEIQQDQLLNQYDTLIIDEVHERSLNIDFLLGYIKQLLPRRPELKIIITSATIDVERFSKHFDGAPVLEVSGRLYPVQTFYRPPEELDTDVTDKDQLQQQGIIEAIKELEQLEEKGAGHRLGDILIFLSGEREIRETAKRLRHEKFQYAEVLPLYARLSVVEQQRIFHPKGKGRRIILATNVAETSLTVPGIRYVIDAGFARISRYSVHSKVQRLPVEPVSQASANQRKGRCGRLSEGICIRLYSEEDFNSRPLFTDAEILRTSLASVILQMLNIRLGSIDNFAFLDMPSSRAINDGFKLLQELGAVNKQHKLTGIGRQLARLPLDPRMGRMLIAGAKESALAEVLIVVSALSIQDPRERPQDKRQSADEKHGEFADEHSDFLTLINLWQWFEKHREELTQNQFRKLCKQYFLNFMRMREWRDMHRQLLIACKGLSFTLNKAPADYVAIHKSLLSGLLTHIGLKHTEADYQGVRNRKFWVAPGSVLFKKKPKWCMAAELLETSRLFARQVAKIEPEWIEPLAMPLVKRTVLDPHWERKRSQVVATEQVVLYGLLISKHKVNYGQANPKESREIFIRKALVEGDFFTKQPFFVKNKKLIAELELLEDKVRKKDILVDDEIVFSFYNEHLPENVYSGKTLDQWLKNNHDGQNALGLMKEHLMQRSADDADEKNYPESIKIEGSDVKLSYVFSPGEEDDGVTIHLPLPLLSRFSDYRAEWLTPGLLYDKVIGLIRTLPKALRKNFIPAPDFSRAVTQTLSPCDEPLLPILSEKLFKMTGVRVPVDAWSPDQLDNYLKMNIYVLDEHGKILGKDRNLSLLRKKFAGKEQFDFKVLKDSRWEQQGLTDWSFGELPESVTIKKAGLQFTSYPALVDKHDCVDLTLFENKALAKQSMRLGLARLIALQLSNVLKHMTGSLKHLDKICILGLNILTKSKLVNDITYLVISEVFLSDESEWPRTDEKFRALVESRRSDVVEQGEKIQDLLMSVMTSYHSLMKRLKNQVSLSIAFSMSDIKCQLQNLISQDFLQKTPGQWLREYPRYLNAIDIRLRKIGENGRKDQLFAQQLQDCWQAWCECKEHLEKQNRYDENLEFYRWMLEEYRVSLFAQTLKTKFPVSSKRLKKVWNEIEK